MLPYSAFHMSNIGQDKKLNASVHASQDNIKGEGKLKSYLPTVVNQQREGAEVEDPQSSEQLTPTLHPEGAGILKGQSR